MDLALYIAQIAAALVFTVVVSQCVAEAVLGADLVGWMLQVGGW